MQPGGCLTVKLHLFKVKVDDYGHNDNIMRGAAKSLAPLPTAWMDKYYRGS